MFHKINSVPSSFSKLIALQLRKLQMYIMSHYAVQVTITHRNRYRLLNLTKSYNKTFLALSMLPFQCNQSLLISLNSCGITVGRWFMLFLDRSLNLHNCNLDNASALPLSLEVTYLA